MCIRHLCSSAISLFVDRPENADGGDQDEPEPEEDVDVLVVEVDGQDALDGVRMDVDHVLAADLEVAERDARERDVALLGPVAVLDEAARHVEPERVVLGREDGVEGEQLADDVADVEHLGDEEQHEQVVGDPISDRYENQCCIEEEEEEEDCAYPEGRSEGAHPLCPLSPHFNRTEIQRPEHRGHCIAGLCGILPQAFARYSFTDPEVGRLSWPRAWVGANSFAPRLLRDDFRGRRASNS